MMECTPGKDWPTVQVISVSVALTISQLTSPIVTLFLFKTSSLKPDPVSARSSKL